MQISLSEVKRLASDASSIVAKEKTLVELVGEDVLVVGDTHGDYDSTVNALSMDAKINVFLGDYVDRGPKQIENIVELMERKVSEPSKTILLRGNHETRSMNVYYGFYREVRKRWGEAAYGLFAEFFSYLPLAAVINGYFLLLHGGIPQGARSVLRIAIIERGEEDVSDPVALQVLWNDPSLYVEYFAPSPRGGGARVFGKAALDDFLQNSSLSMLIRAHEPVSDGYEYLFDNKLLTLFSCRYYGIRPAAARITKDKSIEIVSLA